MTSEPTSSDAPQMSEGYGMAPEGGVDHRSWPATVDAFHTGRSWWVSTSRPDGRPHAMPVWGVVVDGRMIFSTDPGSVKGRNLAADPRAVVHLESGDDVAIVEADVAKITHEALPGGFAQAYEEKYGLELDVTLPEFGWYELAPTKAFSWDENEFVETAVRWRF